VLVHEFDDNKKIHRVILKVQEGTNIKEIKKTVLHNTKNLAFSKKQGLNLFTYPEYDKETNIITVEDEGDNVMVHLGESNGEHMFYAVDYDIYEDSDLNG
jgi:hypothetical protein